MINRVVNLK